MAQNNTRTIPTGTRDIRLERIGDRLWLGIRENGVTIVGVSLDADQARALDEALGEVRPRPLTHHEQIAALPIGSVFRRPGLRANGTPRTPGVKVSETRYYSVSQGRLYDINQMIGVDTETNPIMIIR
jgi:hypothetical protein